MLLVFACSLALHLIPARCFRTRSVLNTGFANSTIIPTSIVLPQSPLSQSPSAPSQESTVIVTKETPFPSSWFNPYLSVLPVTTSISASSQSLPSSASHTSSYGQSPGATDENSYPTSVFDPEESPVSVKPSKTGTPAVSMVHISNLPQTYVPPTSRPVVTHESPVPEESFIPVDLTFSSQHLAKTSETVSAALTPTPKSLPDLQTTQTNAPTIKATSAPTIVAQPASTSLDTGASIANAIASVMGVSLASLSPTTISETPEYVFTALMTQPLSPGMTISGSTTAISGKPNIAFPSIITIPAMSLPGALTQISGTMKVVISGPTTIPLNPELQGLSGSTTVISGSSYVIVPGPTTIPVVFNPASQVPASLPGSLTEISGTLDVVISGPTTLPFNPQFSGLGGSTTVISGSTYLILTKPTTIAASQVLGSLPGSLTEVSGTLEVVISGPTTIPVNSELPGLYGSTTVISDSTYVVVTGPTTVPAVLTTPLSAATTGSGSSLHVSAGSPRPKMASILVWDILGIIVVVVGLGFAL